MSNKNIKTIYIVLISLCALCMLFSAFVTVLAYIVVAQGKEATVWPSLVAGILMLAMLAFLVVDFVKFNKKTKMNTTVEENRVTEEAAEYEAESVQEEKKEENSEDEAVEDKE